MNVTREKLISVLPGYKDQWVVVNKQQEVRHIIKEVLEANQEFQSYYDRLAPYFWTGDVGTTCKKIYNFLLTSIKYREESEHVQTSALPTGILHRGFGDCKHFALFAGGVLGAIERVYSVSVDWCFCFASYKISQRTPYHVFVVCETDDGPMWVDPTPGASGAVPVWVVCRKADGSDCNEMVTGETGTVGAVGCSGCACDHVGSTTGYSESGEGIIILAVAGVLALLLL